MSDQPANQPEPVDRRAALNYLLAGINAGLPAPSRIRFDEKDTKPTIYLSFDGEAVLDAWSTELELNKRYHSVQPHPIDADYEIWTAHRLSAPEAWHGWRVSAESSEPITDEHIRHWVESGQAAERAAYVASQAEQAGGEQS